MFAQLLDLSDHQRNQDTCQIMRAIWLKFPFGAPRVLLQRLKTLQTHHGPGIPTELERTSVRPHKFTL